MWMFIKISDDHRTIHVKCSGWGIFEDKTSRRLRRGHSGSYAKEKIRETLLKLKSSG